MPKTKMIGKLSSNNLLLKISIITLDICRYRFAADVKESVAESTEMEQIRIDMELDKQQNLSGLGSANGGGRFVRTDSQRDSGLPDLDQPSPVLPSTTNEYNGSFNGTPLSRTYIQGGFHADNSITGPGGASSANATPAPAIRRLSYNSMDSGVVEESADLSV
jgi:hypothetical protein